MRVEQQSTYTAVVGSMSEAWNFVMEYLDRAGDKPSVLITPVWYSLIEGSGGEQLEGFEVAVSGVFVLGDDEE